MHTFFASLARIAREQLFIEGNVATAQALQELVDQVPEPRQAPALQRPAADAGVLGGCCA